MAQPARAGGTPGLSPSRLALGRQLAGECSSCHKAQGTGAIPPVTGRPPAELIALLETYASGTRADGRPANAAMMSVARSLDARQIEAVAAYLATLPPQK